jgi:predicted esterase YcpF (UPF0227 family)
MNTCDVRVTMAAEPFSIIYIHGFNSSPQSHKAQQFKQWAAEYCPDIILHIPLLSPFPLVAIAQLTSIANLSAGRTGFIGSSLGGFYASYLADTFNAPAALINPSVRPFASLSNHLGENENFHTSERYVLTQQHIEDLRSLYVEKSAHPNKLLLLVQTGDETLDFREATAHFYHSPTIIEYGGDHAFQYAERHFPLIVDFLLQHIHQ